MTSYSLIRQAALAGTYVPVPFLVWSIGQSMLISNGAQRLHISVNMLEYLESDVDPADPTRMFDKYEFDWWNGPETVDDRSGEELEKAYYFHVDKVILNFPDIVWGLSLSSTGSKYTRLQISRACHSFRIRKRGVGFKATQSSLGVSEDSKDIKDPKRSGKSQVKVYLELNL